MALLVLLVCSIVVIQVFGEFEVAYYTRLHVEIDFADHADHLGYSRTIGFL